MSGQIGLLGFAWFPFERYILKVNIDVNIYCFMNLKILNYAVSKITPKVYNCQYTRAVATGGLGLQPPPPNNL
jgi:hypothetical protein